MFSAFMLNAWVAGSLVAIAAGLAGYFVVLRGATFAAHALPLGTFPGAAAAALIGINPLFGLIAFAAIGVLLIHRLGRRQRTDVATALTLITLLGLGTLFLSLSNQYASSVYALLFGEILGITTPQLIPIALTTLITATAVTLSFRPLILSTISPDLTPNPSRLNLAFLAILGLTTSVATPIVGALLVLCLMTGPPAAARHLTSHPTGALILAATLSLATIWLSIALSYTTNLPLGVFVGTISAITYAAGRLIPQTRPAHAAQMPSNSTIA